MKNRIYKAICLLTCAIITLSSVCIPTMAKEEASANSAGIMTSVYGYKLNDYIIDYGVVSSPSIDGFFDINDTKSTSDVGGIIYADLVDFNKNNCPFLVIYLLDKNSANFEVHILGYDNEKTSAELIGVISKPYNEIPLNCSGEFNIGHDDKKCYISYKEYQDHMLVNSQYYTVIDNDAIMYIKSPTGVNDVGIVDFNQAYSHSSMDISYYNKTLGLFFKKLKDTTADSVTHEDISERLSNDDEALLEDALAKAVNYCDFDISRFKSMAEYRQAMDHTTNSDRFYLISNMYSLGEEIYYVRFSTDRSFYNYALFRKSDSAPDGYQLLKVRTDCIPLSDIELAKIYDEYRRSTLLLKKSRHSLELERAPKNNSNKASIPKIDVEKKIDSGLRTPLALIGGGISLAILVAVWIILIRINKDEG